jgi:glutathione S-transferase
MTEIVLYRCPTRTNILCPCGGVARRLGKLELSYRTERVPYKRASRPEIEELTRQRRVPVLVDGDEVISDSKRIIQYLEWKYGKDEEEPKPKMPKKPDKPAKKGKKRERRRVLRRGKAKAGSDDG